jgi:GTPase involved in cell partitioning and DNA repair
LPGLIEGAHLNEGMGHKFLKHVERTRILLFVIDINGFQFKPEHPYRSAFETVLLLNRELELYREEMLDKPALCVVTKMDSKDSDRMYEAFLEQMDSLKEDNKLPTVCSGGGSAESSIPINKCVHFDEIIPVSAKFSPKTVEVLKYKVRDWMDTYALSNNTGSPPPEEKIRNLLQEKSQLF